VGYKEKMLADIKELAKQYGELPFIRIDRIEQIINSLPSEEEIAKGMIEEYRKAHHSMYQGNKELIDRCNAVLEDFTQWLEYIERKE